LRTEELALEIPTTHHIVRRLHATRSLVRQVEPHLASEMAIVRSTPPGNDFETLLVESAFNSKRVHIRPGVKYRYRSRTEFRKYLETLMPGFIPSFYLALLLGSLVRIFVGGLTTVGYLLLVASFLVIREAIPLNALIRGTKDTFHFEPNGTLVVTNDRRVRSYKNPSAATGWRGALRIVDAPVIRYSSWLTAYYFDPRFIEEAP